MHTIEQFLKDIAEKWPDGKRGAIESDDALKLCMKAIVTYPTVAEFYVLKGCLIQLGAIDSDFSLEDAEAAFLRAVEIDPACEEAYKELGHFYYAVSPNEDLSRKYFGLANHVAN